MSQRNTLNQWKFILFRIKMYHLQFQLGHLKINKMNITILSIEENFYQSIGVAEILMIKIYEYQ